MEIKVICNSKRRRELIFAVSMYYAKTLKIRRRKFAVTIRDIPDFFATTGGYAAATLDSDKHVVMHIDSKLGPLQIAEVLAHEFIHVEQYALGKLGQYIRPSGEYGWLWEGKKNRCKYDNQPWEIDAYNRQKPLANKIINILNAG
jgi:hypothetical protein